MILKNQINHVEQLDNRGNVLFYDLRQKKVSKRGVIQNMSSEIL